MIKISNEELERIREFESCCNEAINGKYLFSDIKITKILKSIAGSKEIYGYLVECLLNFDFNKELEKATGNNMALNYFKMPEEDYKKVALAFCLIKSMDDKEINIKDFMDKHFSAKLPVDEYKLFTRTILIPFRDEILKHFKLYDAPTIVEDNTAKNSLVDVKNEVINQIKAMKNILQISPKIKEKFKSQLDIVLDACLEATNLKNKKILLALEISLKVTVDKVKQVREMYEDLMKLLQVFYKEI